MSENAAPAHHLEGGDVELLLVLTSSLGLL